MFHWRSGFFCSSASRRPARPGRPTSQPRAKAALARAIIPVEPLAPLQAGAGQHGRTGQLPERLSARVPSCAQGVATTIAAAPPDQRPVRSHLARFVGHYRTCRVEQCRAFQHSCNGSGGQSDELGLEFVPVRRRADRSAGDGGSDAQGELLEVYAER